MTIDEAVNIWMPVVAMGVKDMPEVKEAVRMSIKSLEAWGKVRQEIEDWEKSYGFDKATKYGNKDGKQMDLSYSTMYMYEIAGMVDEIKEIINKHLQGVTNDSCRKETN